MRSYTLPEVAELEGVAEIIVRRWVARGELRAYAVSSETTSKKPRLRVRHADLERFRESRMIPTETTTTRRRRPAQGDIPQYV